MAIERIYGRCAPDRSLVPRQRLQVLYTPQICRSELASRSFDRYKIARQASAYSRLDHVMRDGHKVQQAAADDEQVPNAVGMPQAVIEGKKDNPHGVHYPARGQPDKARGP